MINNKYYPQKDLDLVDDATWWSAMKDYVDKTPGQKIKDYIAKIIDGTIDKTKGLLKKIN